MGTFRSMTGNRALLVWLAAAVAIPACVFATAVASVAQDGDGIDHEYDVPPTVPYSAQRPGDPEAGYRALISNGWVGCGLPTTYIDLLRAVLPEPLQPQFETLSGRPAGAEDTPYFLNRFRTKAGVEVLSPNCLFCHAGRINGELVVGLGNADGDYQVFGPEAETIARWIQRLSWLYFWSPARRHEMAKVGERMAAVAPYITVPIAGSNPTHNLAWALVMHRDPQTLAWSDTPGIETAPLHAPPADVPPWWRMRKKNAMFATAGGQGDHTGFMAVNSTLCGDSVEDFDALFEYFNDIRAFLASIDPPKFPYPIDETLAERGHGVFDDHCSGCHGVYTGDPQNDTYPNRLIAVSTVGTDPALAEYNVFTAKPASDWLNQSVFTRHGKYHPYLAYVAPPLDGIWATAPFLHNGSVPTLAALLDSRLRPTYWTRSDKDLEQPFDSTRYDPDAVGWRYVTLSSGQAAVSDQKKRRRLVDTTIEGFSNAGHTYGDRLSPDQRGAVLEYLKTL